MKNFNTSLGGNLINATDTAFARVDRSARRRYGARVLWQLFAQMFVKGGSDPRRYRLLHVFMGPAAAGGLYRHAALPAIRCRVDDLETGAP
ncbi:hypothetical protein [Maritimibacter sp. 55A14]|uniref:hypothetical protein n=1 Tax=Maritimibacter sp. 55A14 TaxID=2174844 RepID=UPI0011B1DB44|nr:hypothetical protein [Maritimibacter sp. 55A14]